MKKRLLYLLVLSMLFVSLFLPTMHVAAADKTATLDGIFFRPGKGWVVIFSISGRWRSGDLRGNTLLVDGKTFNLYCNFRDDTHISCTMASLEQYIGMPATILFGGQKFGGIVPDRVQDARKFTECPADDYETVYIRATTTEGQVINGSLGYLADRLTIQEAAEIWVSMTESMMGVEIESYQITGVTCTQLGTIPPSHVS